jgi:hypothetical protein
MARFVQIAMGSGAELSYHWLLAKDLSFLAEERYAELSSHVERVMMMLSALSGQAEKRAGDIVVLSQELIAKSQKLSSSNLLPPTNSC